MTNIEKKKYWQSTIDELIREWLTANYATTFGEEVKSKYLHQGIGFIVTHTKYRELVYDIVDMLDEDSTKLVSWFEEVFAYIALTLINELSSE